jgi:hypothetical protein
LDGGGYSGGVGAVNDDVRNHGLRGRAECKHDYKKGWNSHHLATRYVNHEPALSTTIGTLHRISAKLLLALTGVCS